MTSTGEAKIGVGIVGLGTVGTGVVELIRKDARFKIEQIAMRDLTRRREVDLEGIRQTTNPFELVGDPGIDVVIEVAGGLTPPLNWSRPRSEQANTSLLPIRPSLPLTARRSSRWRVSTASWSFTRPPSPEAFRSSRHFSEDSSPTA